MTKNHVAIPSDRHHASGSGALVTSSSAHATRAALDVMAKGGNAVDAFISAALVQCVVEHGSTSLGGAFSVNVHDAASRETYAVYGWMRGAAAENYRGYSYQSPEAWTGRGMALPGYVDGVRAAHALAGKLSWPALFDWAIHYAKEGFELSLNAYCMVRMSPTACRYPDGLAIWMEDGRYRYPGEMVRQPALALTLKGIAEQGAGYFYEGEFARHFVHRAREMGGRHTLSDMQAMQNSAQVSTVALEGEYRGYEVVAPYNAMSIYALHLSEAANLRGLGSTVHPDAVYAKARIVEEVFAASQDYNLEAHARFTDKATAEARIDRVLNGPVRTNTFDLLKVNTNFIVVRDNDGNVAWCTHSINASQICAAGIVVGGVYASFLMNEDHARGNPGASNGFMTNLALYRDGKPVYIAGSPGHGFFHGPYQVMVNFGEFGMEPLEAVKAPRVGFGADWAFDTLEVEGHYPEAVFQELHKRNIKYRRVSPSVSTGMVGAMHIDAGGTATVAQDTRRDGLALSMQTA